LIYFVAGMATCSKCNQASGTTRILKCPVCYKYVCDKCAIRRYSQKFCSEVCSKLFFFGVGEESEGEGQL